MVATTLPGVGLRDGVLFDNQIDGKYLSSAELAHCLGLSEHTIRAWRKYRIITPVKFGRSVRWLLKNVVEELTKRKGQQ